MLKTEKVSPASAIGAGENEEIYIKLWNYRGQCKIKN